MGGHKMFTSQARTPFRQLFARGPGMLDCAWGERDVIGYRLLGPLEVTVDGTAVDLGGLKQRALLAILLLHPNQPVNRDVLVDRLWGEHPPAGAEHAVNVYIWRLRKALQAASGTEGVVTRQGAYLLQAAAEQVDVVLFERLADEGRRALAAEAAGRASALLGECARSLWMRMLASLTVRTWLRKKAPRAGAGRGLCVRAGVVMVSLT